MKPAIGLSWITTRRVALELVAKHGPQAGICSECGCTLTNPCILQLHPQRAAECAPARPKYFACGWADATQTLCTNPVCQAAAAAEESHATNSEAD